MTLAKVNELFNKYKAGMEWIHTRKQQGHDITKDLRDLKENVKKLGYLYYKRLNDDEKKEFYTF